MAKRSAREFAATMEQQMKQFKPVRVNPFPLMMDAARHNQAQQQAAGQPANAGAAAAVGPTCLCSHCGVGLSELQVQQCHACKSFYCSSCSVINYDVREDRVFCLDCNTDGMQLTSCEVDDPSDPFAACRDGFHSAFSMYHQQQQPNHLQQHQQHQQQQQQHCMCSPPSRDITGSSGFRSQAAAAAAAQLSSERRSSVLRACNRAAAAAAVAADSGGSCMAAMAGISGLRKEQMTPLFAAGGLCGGFGSNGGGGGGGSTGGRGGVSGSVLGQWDLNSSPLANMAFVAGALATPKVLPFTAG